MQYRAEIIIPLEPFHIFSGFNHKPQYVFLGILCVRSQQGSTKLSSGRKMMRGFHIL